MTLAFILEGFEQRMDMDLTFSFFNGISLAAEWRTDLKRARLEAGDHLGDHCNHLVRDDGGSG